MMMMMMMMMMMLMMMMMMLMMMMLMMMMCKEQVAVFTSGDASHCKAMGVAQSLLCPRPANNNIDAHYDDHDDDVAHDDTHCDDDDHHGIDDDGGEDEDHRFIDGYLKKRMVTLLMKLRLI